MKRFSLETIGEIVTRLEAKVDKQNGSVADILRRVESLEKKDIEHAGRLGSIELQQSEAKKAHSNLIWKVVAPIGVVLLLALLKLAVTNS